MVNLPSLDLCPEKDQNHQLQMKKYINLTLLVFGLLFAFGSVAQERRPKFSHVLDTYTDTRDGRVYKTITFRRRHHNGYIERTWYAENSKYEVDGSLCYDDLKEYCDAFGRLYNYEQANLACPPGWHVPTIVEWKHLFQFFEGVHHAAKHLHQGGDSDMNMLFGGFASHGKEFQQAGASGNWWDNELKDSNTAGIITLQKDSDQIYHSKVGDLYFLSTRCVKFHN